jgi:hypothetical protein
VESDLYIFQRSLPGGGPGAIVVINRGTVQRPPLEIDLVGSLAAETGPYEDIFSGRKLQLAGTATVVELPPRSVSVYVPAEVLLP